MAKHPTQPCEIDKHGVVRFKDNKIVRALLESSPYGMNTIAMLPFSDEDRVQFAQLIGYSFGGFGELSYVSDKEYNRANKEFRKVK